jgi:hypothetical protein
MASRKYCIFKAIVMMKVDKVHLLGADLRSVPGDEA